MRNPLLCRKADGPAAIGRLDGLAAQLWEALFAEGRDARAAFLEAYPKLRELLLGVYASLPPTAARLQRDVGLAKRDVSGSKESARSGDYESAMALQRAAMLKLRGVLDVLAGRKVAYGYDISGELGEMFHGSEEIANRENQKHIDDTAQPFEQHETPKNPANLSRDYLAERDYPALANIKNKKVCWPPRTR